MCVCVYIYIYISAYLASIMVFWILSDCSGGFLQLPFCCMCCCTNLVKCFVCIYINLQFACSQTEAEERFILAILSSSGFKEMFI